MRFCIKCGNQIIEQAARFCDKCGSPLKDVQDQDQNPHANMKEMEISMSSTEMRIRKIIAVLIAVFLGRCTWLYTLRKDAWKASLGLGITLSLLVTWVVIYITRTRFLATMPPGVIY